MVKRCNRDVSYPVTGATRGHYLCLTGTIFWLQYKGVVTLILFSRPQNELIILYIESNVLKTIVFLNQLIRTPVYLFGYAFFL